MVVGAKPMSRRFPPPWTVEEYNDACFIVRDQNGQQLAYVHFEDEPGRLQLGCPPDSNSQRNSKSMANQ